MTTTTDPILQTLQQWSEIEPKEARPSLVMQVSDRLHTIANNPHGEAQQLPSHVLMPV